MFSLSQMQRQFTTGRFDLLLKSIMHNGLQLPNELAEHLLEHPVCSTALALKRAMEVTYGTPDATTGKMVAFLLETQEADGSFGFAPLPTACGLAALHCVIQQAPQGSLPAVRPQALAKAHDDAACAMLAMIDNEAQHGLTCSAPAQTPLLTESQAIDWAFVLLLLSDDPMLHAAPSTQKLHHWFAANLRQLPDHTARIWNRICWTPPGSVHTPGHARGNTSENIPTRTSGSGLGRDIQTNDTSPTPKQPSHGRFHQSPRSNLRRSGSPAHRPHAA